MARRSGSAAPSSNPNSGNVNGPRTTSQIQDQPADRNRNSVGAPRAATNVQGVQAPRPNVPLRAPDRDSFDPASALASNKPAHIINIGSPSVRPSRSIGSSSHAPQATSTPDSTSATGTGQTPGGQFTGPIAPSRPIARLRNC